MTSRKLVGLFFRTLLLGGIAGLASSFFVEWPKYAEVVKPFDFVEIMGLVVFFIGLGLVFSAVSQTGFFAYLFINRFGLGMFRSYWKMVQVILIAFVVFDLAYFPYQSAKGELPFYMFGLMSLGILVYGMIVAKIKAKKTNSSAFVPTLFLMVVMTAIEWVPGLRVSGYEYAFLMIIPLLACNTYQIMSLHKLSVPADKQNKSTSSSRKQGVHKKTAKV